MNKIIKILADRELGQYPMSIATSLAFEGAMGIYPEKELPKAPLIEGQYRLIAMNAYTLYRNMIESCDRAMVGELKWKATLDAFLEELNVIETTIEKIGKGRVGALVYFANYSKLPKEYPFAILKGPTTPKQVFYRQLEQDAFKHIQKEIDHWPIEMFDGLGLKGQYPKSLILTHCLTDLFSRYQFDHVDLLESHTGAIKPHTQWNTKLTNGKDLVNIPFNRFTLQIFGDKGHQFSPATLKLKRAVLDCAEKDRWTVLTTMDKIKVSLNGIEDLELRQLAFQLM